MKLTTTLNRIRACSPCREGWRTLTKHLGEAFDPDAEINLLTILDSNGVADMLWTLRATVQDSRRIASQLAIEFAEEMLPIFEKQYPADQRPRRAVQAARDYPEGKVNLDELRKARSAATAADAYAASYAASAAAAAADAYAAYAAAASASAAAYAAADAYADAYAASASYVAACERAREHQAELVRSVLE